MATDETLLKMSDGVSAAEKIRTSEASLDRLVALFEEKLPLEKVALVHTHALGEVEALRRRLEPLLPMDGVLSVDVTPARWGHTLAPMRLGSRVSVERAVSNELSRGPRVRCTGNSGADDHVCAKWRSEAGPAW